MKPLIILLALFLLVLYIHENQNSSKTTNDRDKELKSVTLANHRTYYPCNEKFNYKCPAKEIEPSSQQQKELPDTDQTDLSGKHFAVVLIVL